MRARDLLLLPLALVLISGVASADDDNPHHMRHADGSTDDSKCGVCHDDDLGLLQSKLETCTMCHGEIVHSGSREHLQASPAAVAKRLAGQKNQDVVLPLTDEGGIYCGTCHIFHDPVVSSEPLLERGRSASASPVAAAVRDALTARWTELAKAHGRESAETKLNEQGTRRLRLPNADGALCRHCHQEY